MIEVEFPKEQKNLYSSGKTDPEALRAHANKHRLLSLLACWVLLHAYVRCAFYLSAWFNVIDFLE